MNAKEKLDKVHFFSQQIICHLSEQDFYETIEGELTAIKFEADVTVDKIKELVQLRQELGQQIDRLEKPEHRLVLRLRYFGNYSWRNIASQMNYGKRYIFFLHNKALDELDKLMKCEEEERKKESEGNADKKS